MMRATSRALSANSERVEWSAPSVFCWNIFWWDWCNLDERDVKLGWQQNLVLFAVVAVVTGIFWGPVIALICTLGLHLLTLWIGLGLRSGTQRDQ